MQTKGNASMSNRLLGHGVYGIPEVSRYTGLGTQRIYSWFKSGTKTKQVFAADYPPVDNSYAVSFLDMIDVLVAGQLREQGVSLRTVREAYNILKEDLSTHHPFCHQSLYVYKGKIFTQAAKKLEKKTLYEVLSGQHFIPNVMMPYVKRIDYSKKTKLAERWRIADGVVVDPRVSFGKPVVEETGTTTYVISRSYRANNRDEELVADLFEISPSAVIAAVSFEENHPSSRAA